ncbi:hypothetical protein MUK42_06613 [Musa troglodytarum]|uniref:Uncharacterized protein n=1 Tax=Musa troglodytarum TaxID=320322 RepID=A0A9E7KKT1_9LILI|nr:hypothetical protein MUK42_06613 [Musa troglodytarum]
MDRGREKRSVVGHEVRDLPLLAGHQCGLLRDSEPDTDSGKTEYQAEKPTAEANPDNGEHRQASPALRRQGVPVQVPVPGEGAGVEPGQRGGGGGGSRHRRPVGQQRRYGTLEAVVGDVEGREAAEEAELVGYEPREDVGVEVEDVEVGAEREVGGNGAGEAVGGEVEDGEVEEGGELRGDGAGEGLRIPNNFGKNSLNDRQ